MNEVQALPVADRLDQQPGRSAQSVFGLTAAAWVRIGVVTILMAALFWPNLRRLWLKTNPFTGESNWAHAFFIPLIGLYYLYVNRETLLSPERAEPLSVGRKALGGWMMLLAVVWGTAFLVWAYYPRVQGMMWARATAVATAAISVIGMALMPARTRSLAPLRQRLAKLAEGSSGWFGLYTMAWGLVLYAWSIYPGRNDFLKDFGMVATLFGVVLFLCDWGVMRLAWFPIAFLVCALPWPPLIYSKLALPLQKLAAMAAAWTLRATGVDAVLDEGSTILMIGARQLNVAEACAGLKSLMTFISVGAAVGFLSARPLWQKITISLSAIPIAIFCNMLRVAGQGLLDHYWDPRISESFAHQFVGMIMLVPAFFLILLVCWVLDNLFIEEAGKRKAERPAAQSLVIEAPRVKAAASKPATSEKKPEPAGAAEAPASNEVAAAAARLAALRTSRGPRAQSADKK